MALRRFLNPCSTVGCGLPPSSKTRFWVSADLTIAELSSVRLTEGSCTIRLPVVAVRSYAPDLLALYEARCLAA
jgi:hypothetical protein